MAENDVDPAGSDQGDASSTSAVGGISDRTAAAPKAAKLRDRVRAAGGWYA